jgi:hypothetical protein
MTMKTRYKVGLGIAALALVVAVGFAFTRGYFMHFVVEGESYSRDAFLALADEAAHNPNIHVNCAQGEVALGWLYVYETHCFDTQDEVIDFMNRRDGQP